MSELINDLAGWASPALDLLLQATGVLVVASLVAWRRRDGSAAWRHGVWLGAFALIAALPLVYGFLPRRLALTTEYVRSTPVAAAMPEVATRDVEPSTSNATSVGQDRDAGAEEIASDSPRGTAADESSLAPDVAATEVFTEDPTEATLGESSAAPLARLAPREGALTPGLRSSAASFPSISWSGVLLAIWCAGALVVLGRGALGRWRVGQWLRGSQRVETSVRKLGAEAADQAGLARPLPLRESSAVEGPALVGFFRPRVLLPAGLLRGVEARVLRPLILHEKIHAARRDHLVHGLLQLVRAVLWFHPLAHLGLRAVARDRELLTDAAVVSRLGRRSDYAEGILHVMRGGPLPFAAALGVADARGREVEERLEAIVGGRSASWRAPSRGARALAVLGFVGLAVFVTAIGLEKRAVALNGGGAPAARGAEEGGEVVQDEATPVERSDEPVLVVVDMPEPRPRSRGVEMLDWPEWRRALAGRYVLDGRPLDFRGFRKRIKSYGIARTEMQRASDPKQSRADLVLRIHPDRAASDVADVIALARTEDIGIRQIRLSLLGSTRATVVLPPPLPAVAEKKASLGRDTEWRIVFTLPGFEEPQIVTTPEDEGMAAFAKGLGVFMRSESLTRVSLTWAPEIKASRLVEIVGVLEDDMRARLVHVAGRPLVRIPKRAKVSTKKVDQAVAKGLAFLARAQAPDGSISVSSEKSGRAIDRREGTAVGRTALALLCFLDAGHTHLKGDYRRIVERGVEYIQGAGGRPIGEHGCLGGTAGYQRNYSHAIATSVLARLYRTTNDASLKPGLASAVKYILYAQNPYQGWRYGIRDGDNDTSVTTWMLTALLDARDAGIEVDKGRIEWALAWYDNMTDRETGRIGYIRKGGLPVRTAGAIEKFPATEVETPTAMALSMLARTGSRLDKSDLTRRSAVLLGQKPPFWSERQGGIDFIYWCWGTRASRAYGPELSTAWNQALGAALVPKQIAKGSNTGSWDPVGAWGESSGRVGTTALAVLALQESRRR